jgi:hypothetical protein
MKKTPSHKIACTSALKMGSEDVRNRRHHNLTGTAWRWFPSGGVRSLERLAIMSTQKATILNFTLDLVFLFYIVFLFIYYVLTNAASHHFVLSPGSLKVSDLHLWFSESFWLTSLVLWKFLTYSSNSLKVSALVLWKTLKPSINSNSFVCTNEM